MPMSVERQQPPVKPDVAEIVPTGFIVYPAVLRADDFRTVPTHEWRRLLRLGKDASDPRNAFVDQKKAEGFRFAGQSTMQFGATNEGGQFSAPDGSLEARDANSALLWYESLVADNGVDNVIACRPAPDGLMSPNRAPIDEVIFLRRAPIEPEPKPEGLTVESFAQILNEVRMAGPSIAQP